MICMKKMTTLFLAAVLFSSLSACGAEGSQNSRFSGSTESNIASAEQETQNTISVQTETAVPGSTDAQGEQRSNILVAYFSWADNAVLADDVDAVSSPSVILPGNVQQLASWVQEETDGDLFSIRVTEPYSSDWDECLERANQERGDNARPELVENVDNLEQYDTVFLGYPNWLAYHKLIQCTQIA